MCAYKSERESNKRDIHLMVNFQHGHKKLPGRKYAHYVQFYIYRIVEVVIFSAWSHNFRSVMGMGSTMGMVMAKF